MKTALNNANRRPRNSGGVVNPRPRNTGGGGARELAPGNGYLGGGQGGSHAGGGHGGGGHGGGAQVVRAGESRDPAFTAIKRTLCKLFNERRGCDRPDSCQRLHKCSVRIGDGQASLAEHPYHLHRN